VLVAGVNRHGVRILNPRAEEVVQAGDEVLTLGTADQIRSFKAWLREEPSAVASIGD
jgi:CPA2 family monovalent cation:H+ antiporter-2